MAKFKKKVGFGYLSEIDKWLDGFNKYEVKNRNAAARHVKKIIKKKALAMKKTGNLAEGVYHYYLGYNAHVGIHYPAYHAYLIEFGHRARDGSMVRPHPIVYPSFEESKLEVENIFSRPFDV